ncbi:hypothetical protein FQZ97_1167410 [compost metagenome]
MTGNSPRSTPRVFWNTVLIMPWNMSRMSSSVRNEVSISICVNSGWRSARRSSSRKHLVIW